MKMSKLLCYFTVLTVFIALNISPADASVQRYYFTGMLDLVPYPIFPAASGDPVSGYFDYDPTTQLDFPYISRSGFEMTIDDITLWKDSGMHWVSSGSFVYFSMETGIASTSTDWYFGDLVIRLHDNEGLAFSDLPDLPELLPLGELDEFSFGLMVYSGTIGLFELRGTLDSFKAATPAPVPEPSTLLLLGAGIGGLALRRKRANQSSIR